MPSVSKPRTLRKEIPSEGDGTTQLGFRFHARALAALGRDLVTDDVVAVIELVKNAYDALATHVEVRIRPEGTAEAAPYIEVSDDGHGMDYATIRDVWCVIATPHKQESPVSRIGPRSRHVTGEKGLGRLSTARLGSTLDVTTKSRDSGVLRFSIDWERLLKADDLDDVAFNVSRMRSDEFDREHGTHIRIGGLDSHWNKEKIDDLHKNLARLVSPFSKVEDFSISLDAIGDGGETDVQDITPPDFLSQPKYSIEGDVDAEGTILCRYRFRPIDDSDGRDCEMREEWSKARSFDAASERMGFRESSPGCGPFQFEIRAWDLTKDDTRDIAEHFGENRSHVRAAIASQQGVSIYRDDILVLPKSAGARDWLGLDLRRVSRLGSRLSTSQVLGCVQITKAGNPRIVDTSDREGLVSNTEMLAFRYLVRRIVGLLEQQRHIDRMDSKDTGTATELFANINAEPLVAKLETLRDSGGDVSAAVEAAKDFGNELDRSRAVIERRFGYYNRLAVIGTIAQIVIHEIRNRTTVIGRGLRKGKELAERVGDEIRGRALAMAKESVLSLEDLADRFAPLASRGYRAGRRSSIVEESIERCRTMQAPEIRSSGVSVEWPTKSRTTVQIDPAEIDTIILNLVTNSLYWMQRQDGDRHLRFRVTQGPAVDRVTVSVDDSGPGIQMDDRERVFWPGVTRKPDGIGMGLTVASELVDGRGGKMRTVVPGELKGATFEFDLPLAQERTGEDRP